MMNTMELRNKLLQSIHTADERLLRIVNAVFESYQESEEVVAYTIDGKPVSKQDYIQRNKQAIVSFEKGFFKTQDQMLSKYKAGQGS